MSDIGPKTKSLRDWVWGAAFGGILNRFMFNTGQTHIYPDDIAHPFIALGIDIVIFCVITLAITRLSSWIFNDREE